MGFKADYTDVDAQEGGGIVVLPKGRYLAVVDKADGKTSTGGRPMVVVDYKVVTGEYAGNTVKWQNVVFLPKTHQFAGISLGVLKNLRQPYKGQFIIEPDNWVGKHVYISVDVEDYYSEKHEKNFERNVVKGVFAPTEQELVDLGETGDGQEPVEEEDAPAPKPASRRRQAPKTAKTTAGKGIMPSDDDDEEVPF